MLHKENLEHEGYKDVIGDRSFGENKQQIVELVLAAINALKSQRNKPRN